MRNGRCDFVSLSRCQWFPLWLGYCGCFLERQGCQVRLIDAPAYNLSFAQTEQIFVNYRPDLLVVYTGDKSADSDLGFVERLLARYSCPVVLVGPYFSIDPVAVLARSQKIHYGVRGEFELAVWELLNGKNPAKIENLIWQDQGQSPDGIGGQSISIPLWQSPDGIGGQLRENKQRPYLNSENLDDMPFVSEFFARQLNFRFYRAPSEPHPFIDILTGRGCSWGACTFCLWPRSFIKGRVYNTRSIDNVMEELAYIESCLPKVRSVMLQDDTFPAKRIREFSEAKLQEGIKLAWSCYVRGDLDKDTLRLMRRAGCRNLHVGYESGNDETLQRIGKGLTREQLTKFTANAKKAGLKIHADFVFGFPRETEQMMMATMNWVQELKPHTAQFQLLIPFQNTSKISAANRREKTERLAKKAYRQFYFSPSYLSQILRHPGESLFKRLPAISRALPAVCWRRWDNR